MSSPADISNGDSSGPHYLLKLYITGTTPNSARAIVNIRRLCEERLAGRYELEIVDILKHPIRAKDDQILAAPTLIRYSPLPLRRLIGDMSQTERLTSALDIRQL